MRTRQHGAVQDFGILMLKTAFAFGLTLLAASGETLVSPDLTQPAWLKSGSRVFASPQATPGLSTANLVEVRTNSGGQVAHPFTGRKGEPLSISVCLKGGAINALLVCMVNAAVHLAVDLGKGTWKAEGAGDVLARLWMGAQPITKWQALYSCQSTSPGGALGAAIQALAAAGGAGVEKLAARLAPVDEASRLEPGLAEGIYAARLEEQNRWRARIFGP